MHINARIGKGKQNNYRPNKKRKAHKQENNKIKTLTKR